MKEEENKISPCQHNCPNDWFLCRCQAGDCEWAYKYKPETKPKEQV